MIANQDMDINIKEVIKSGAHFAHQINAILGGKWSGTPEEYKTYRQIDRRLQAMRKNGDIVFSHGFGWRLTK